MAGMVSLQSTTRRGAQSLSFGPPGKPHYGQQVSLAPVGEALGAYWEKGWSSDLGDTKKVSSKDFLKSQIARNDGPHTSHNWLKVAHTLAFQIVAPSRECSEQDSYFVATVRKTRCCGNC